MKKQQRIVFLFLLSSVFITAQSWIPVGNATGFSNTSAADQHLAIDSNNVLYIAYQNTSGTPKNTTVKKFNGTTWETVGTTNFAANASTNSRNQSLMTDSNNVPYVAFSSFGDASVRGIKVMKFNGTAWESFGVGLDSDGRHSTNLAIDSNNMPIVASRGEATNDNFYIKKYNSSNNTWELLGGAGFTDNSNFPVLVLDTNDIPYIAYEDRANGTKEAVVRKFNANTGQWDLVGVQGFSDGGIGYIDFAIDTNNVLYVAYIDEANSSKLTVKKFVNTNWETVGTTGFSNVALSGDISLALDNNNLPYVAYRRSPSSFTRTTEVLKFNGTIWEALGGDTQFANDADHHDLIIDNNNTPYLAYKDFDNGGKTVVLKFDATASVKDHVLQAQITLYPNPITDKLSVNSSILSIQQLEIYNVLGKRLITAINKTTLHLSRLATGIYLLKISTDKGVVIKKFIKNK